MNEIQAPNQSSISFGLVLLCVAAFAIYFAKGIDPSTRAPIGPRAFPIGLSICLAAIGLQQLSTGVVFRIRDGSSRSFGRRDVVGTVLVAAALILYVPAIPLLGFSISSLVFATALMRRMKAAWWQAALVSLVLIAAIKFLFRQLFKVQLPEAFLDAFLN